MKTYIEYAKKVVNNEIIACEYIQLACKQFLHNLERTDIEFKEEKVDRVINFIKHLKHFTGQHNNKPFILQPWQQWIVASIFGFFYTNTEERVVKNVYIEIARKNGKSSFAAALCLYALIGDGENNSEVELIANSRKQASICFEMCSNFCKSIDSKGKFFKYYRDNIKYPHTKSFLQVLSSDASNNDGWNSYLFVADEVHSYDNSKMFDVMKSSQGMRNNPLAISITTAGFNLYSFCYGMRQTNIEILRGAKQDDSQFTAIFTLDNDDDWENEDNWVKANPNLGVTVKPQYLREQIQQAKNNPSLEVSTKTKNFNMWLQTSDIWIGNDDLLKVSETVDIEELAKEGYTCYMGVDLAAVSDLTALTMLIPMYDKYLFKTWYFLPSATLYDNSNADLYKEWKRRGELIITDGNVTDYDAVTNMIMKVGEKIPIERISYDNWNATEWAIRATELGLPLIPYSQAIGNFNRPTKALERAIKQGTCIIDNNTITRWCFSNVILKRDWNDNCLALDTIIPTPNGYKTIGDIQINDYVFDEHGKPVKVIDTTDIHYNRDCYKLTFANGSEVVCDSTHNWYVDYWTTGKGHRNEKKCGLKDTEWIFKNYKKSNGSKYLHTFYNGAIEYSEKSYTIDPYVLGLWLGDGSKGGSVFTCEEKDLIMYKSLEKKYNVKYRFDEGKTYIINVSKGLRTELKNLNLLNNKHIPCEYLLGSINQRLELLRGLMDTDGTCNKYNGQCVFCQSNGNKQIIDGMCELLSSLGIRHTVNIKDTYTIIQFYTNIRVFNLERKFERQKQYIEKPQHKYNTILNVEKVNSVPTKCITVDSENHLFLITNKYTLTSNCKPTKAENQQKIDGVIAMIMALGGLLETPQYSQEILSINGN